MIFRRRIVSTIALAGVLVTAASANAAELTPRDAKAAGAVKAHELALKEAVDTCRPIVAASARPMIDQLWAQWSSQNAVYVERANYIYQAAAGGPFPSRKVGVGRDIQALPTKQREEKCYGILTSIANGDWNIRTKLPSEARQLTASAAR